MPEKFATVAELLAVPERWTQGCTARDAHGTPCNDDSPAAESFCLLGAVDRVYGGAFSDESDAAAKKLFAALLAGGFDCNVARFNDGPHRTHAEVLALAQKAGI